MPDIIRKRLSMAGVVVGLGMLVLGIVGAHFSGLAETNSVGQEIYPHVPRCAPFEPFIAPSDCWVLPTSAQLVALLGSQVLFAAIAFGWILGKPLTWARATAAAFLVTLEMLILFGVVPHQFLTLTQGAFEWTYQKEAFTIPRWLVLNNDVSISYGVIKDAVSGGYSAVLLGIVAVTAYQVQERAKRRKSGKADTKISDFGRPLVKGGR